MVAEKRWLFTFFFATSIFFVFFLVCSIHIFTSPEIFSSVIHRGQSYPPSFAYYISGGRGDGDRILRLLLAVYHPRNRYLLHLAADASDGERRELIADVNAVPPIKAFRNVDVMGKPNRINYMGSSRLAATLRAAAILLKVDDGWDWFVELSAADYPLVTQDDLFHVFYSISRDINFIDHYSNLGWKASARFEPVIVDPAIYLARKSEIFYATQNRPIPDAFKIFTGSPWIILSQSFLEYCVLGWDNLPRMLHLYFNNIVLSEESYFHSVICNTPEFVNTTVNADLRYVVWDNPPKMQPHFLSISDYNQMVQSGAAFARQFKEFDPVLDMIDEKILNRKPSRVTPGAWCTGRRGWWGDPCAEWGDVNAFNPRKQAKKFKESVLNLLDDWNSQMNQCK